MHMNESELETKMEQIIDQMGDLMMDVILMSFKKINTHNQLFHELMEIRLENRKEEKFYGFGEAESGSAGEQPDKG